MRVTLENTESERKSKTIIEVNNDDLNIDEAIEMIASALIAFGYHPDNVYDRLKEG